MQSRQRNITPRPNVYSEERQEISDSKMKGFGKLYVQILKEKMENWPEPLKVLYDDCESADEEDDELIRIRKTLLKLKDRRLSLEYTNLLEDCNDYFTSSLSSYQPESPSSLPFYQPKSASPERIEKLQPECLRVNQNREISKNESKFFNLVCVFFIGIIIMAVPLYFTNKQDVPEFNSDKIEMWTRSIKYLQEKFPSQNKLIWPEIVSGVKTVVTEKPTKPGVLLLLHDDEKTSSCLAKKIGKEAAKLLGEELIQEPILIKGEDLKSNKSLTKDYGEFSETYRHEIQKKHVMIILDLQEIPALLAQAFHVLCDVENPLIHNAAFLFTMQVDGSDKRRPTAIAEEKLEQLWKDTLDIDTRAPLITRITDAVVSVKMETHLPC